MNRGTSAGPARSGAGIIPSRTPSRSPSRPQPRGNLPAGLFRGYRWEQRFPAVSAQRWGIGGSAARDRTFERTQPTSLTITPSPSHLHRKINSPFRRKMAPMRRADLRCATSVEQSALLVAQLDRNLRPSASVDAGVRGRPGLLSGGRTGIDHGLTWIFRRRTAPTEPRSPSPEARNNRPVRGAVGAVVRRRSSR